MLISYIGIIALASEHFFRSGPDTALSRTLWFPIEWLADAIGDPVLYLWPEFFWLHRSGLLVIAITLMAVIFITIFAVATWGMLSIVQVVSKHWSARNA